MGLTDTIVVVGATGCVGSAVVERLLAQGRSVRCLVRTVQAAQTLRAQGAEAVVGDLLDAGSLRGLCNGATAVYYLVHPLRVQPFDRSQNPGLAGHRGLGNLLEAARQAGTDLRWICLGSLATRTDCLPLPATGFSPMIDVIRESGFPYTIFLSGLVVGARSLPFRVLFSAVCASWLVPLPRWTILRTQPIALADLVGYLVDCLDEPLTINETFDVGGNEVLAFEELLARIAKVLGRRRLFLRLPFGNSWFWSKVEHAVGPLSPTWVDVLPASILTDTLCHDTRIATLLPRRLLSVEESLRAIVPALSREQPKDRRPT